MYSKEQPELDLNQENNNSNRKTLTEKILWRMKKPFYGTVFRKSKLSHCPQLNTNQSRSKRSTGTQFDQQYPVPRDINANNEENNVGNNSSTRARIFTFVSNSDDYHECNEMDKRNGASLVRNKMIVHGTEGKKSKSSGTQTKDRNLIDDQIQTIILADCDRLELLEICSQQCTLPFELVYPKSAFSYLERFDSGTYAEVFCGRDKQNQIVVFKVIRAVSTQLRKRLKNVSFKGTENYKEIINEVVISNALSRLHSPLKHNGSFYEAHCFPKILRTRVVEGEIPEYFLKTECLTNDLSPVKEDPFVDLPYATREHVVISMGFYGNPLWKLLKNHKISSQQLLSVCHQLSFGLAVAESVYQFEHRDLHISNVLVKQTKKSHIRFMIDNMTYDVQSYGVKATIIDTTFSRLQENPLMTYYKDLTTTFSYTIEKEQQDKLTTQDKTYRRMVKETRNNWKKWSPQTNNYWLYYLFSTVSKCFVVSKEVDNYVRDELDFLKDNVLRFQCVADFISFTNHYQPRDRALT